MLRIEKVFVQGFKSFCDPTEVAFDEEGITGVVGPNGCGKSNLSEAISWVIGEQRARALRGGKMEDVIFQGSRNRPAAGMAEVLLTLVVRETFEIRSENTKEIDAPPVPALSEEPETVSDEQPKKKRKAPQMTSRVYAEGEKITVGRRLYRTGESEYEMNGRGCRLRDIQDLFAGTGLGGAHYAIIEQGRIGQVLSAKPLDRRSLIEEAAGISKFKMRQHAAELKLEASRQNLARLTDIIIEIEKQQNSLKRQASKARRYQRLRDEMRQLQRTVFIADYREQQDSLTSLEESWKAISLRESEAVRKIETLEAQHTVTSATHREREQLLSDSRQKANEVDIEAQRAQLEHQHLNEQLQAQLTRAQEQERAATSIIERSRFIEEESTRLQSELEELAGQINSQATVLAESEQSHREALVSDAQLEQDLETARQQLLGVTTNLERWRQVKNQCEDSRERSTTRLNGLQAEHSRTEAQSLATAERQASLTELMHTREIRQSEISSELGRVQSDLADQREKRARVTSEHSTAREELSSIEHRLKSLVQLDDRHAYFSEPVQELLNRAEAGEFRALGTLADFVHPTPENEAMIEAVLHDELEYVVVPGYEDALQGIEMLASEGRGRGTFLCVGLHGADHSLPLIDSESQSGNESGERLLDLLNLRRDFSLSFELAFPQLARARVYDTATEALSSVTSDSSICVTRTGERIVGSQVITGGTRADAAADGHGKGVLALKREISELTDRFGEASVGVAGLESQVRGLDEQMEGLEARRHSLDEQLRTEEREMAVLREQAQQCERDAERIAEHIRIVVQERAQVEAELAEIESRLSEAELRVNESEALQRSSEETVSVKQTEVAEMRRAAEERLESIASLRAEFATRNERRRGLESTISRLNTESAELAETLNRTRFESVEGAERINQLKSSIEERSRQIEEVSARQTEMATQVEQQRIEMIGVREQLDGIDAELRSSRDTSQQAREERAQIELDRVRLTSEIAHIADSCHHELGETIEDLLSRENVISVDQSISSDDEDETDDWQMPDHFDLPDAKSKLEALRSSIENLGPINMMALEELTEVKERFQFLSQQKADIENAVVDTQTAIAEIKRRSRERFVEAFREINSNFSTTFQELFGGGRGEMRLIDETDILESGIEIIAQPPGKRLQNVLLLSGGEKAMTAIALVLAIFKYRPSPFCILDEVDAPLDEVNIGRFVDKVVEMSRSTQFMIVTHAKRTMEAARALYGVTMEDPGVSKLVSVRLT